MEFMRYLVFLFCTFLSVPALASPPFIPLNQYLEAIDYFKKGEQSGCGIRITGEAENNLWVNVLISVFVRESGALFGMFKVDVKKINMMNGKPLTRDGKVIYSNIGKIRDGWIKTDSGIQLSASKDGGSQHNEGYMTSMEFNKAMGLLIAVPQTNFKVGYSKKDGAEEVFEFNKRITRNEADNLSSCMKNLRDAREGKRNLLTP